MNRSPGRSLLIHFLRPDAVCWLAVVVIAVVSCSGGTDPSGEPNPVGTPEPSAEAGPRHVSSFDPELGLSQSWRR